MKTSDKTRVQQHQHSTKGADENQGITIGIMNETYNKWERRAPICPAHVHELMTRHPRHRLAKVFIQPSARRIFSDDEYQQANAVVQENLEQADLILGVKRPENLESLIPGKSYIFFSHVIKGQAENMQLLEHVLDKKIQLFDYECIVQGGVLGGMSDVDQKKKRLVAFGEFAGRAGMIDGLHGLGLQLLLDKGYSTPFLNCPLAFEHFDWQAATVCLKRIGEKIASDGLATEEPIVVCITGKGGNVHSGAMKVMRQLPIQLVTIDELPTLHKKPGPHRCLYVLQLTTADIVAPNDKNVQFDRSRYQHHPEEYHSTFYTNVAPFITLLVNGIYWDERFPRLLTKEQLRQLSERQYKRLLVVSDITCDVGGSIEFLEHTTSIDKPYLWYDPLQQKEVPDGIGGAVLVAGVDILPSELPRDSSMYFGNALLPILDQLIASQQTGKRAGYGFALSALSPELAGACIAMNGKLTSGFGYIQALMESRQDQKRVRKSFLLWPIFKANIGDLRDSFVSKPSQLITWLKEHVTRRKSHGCLLKSELVDAALDDDVAQIQVTRL